MEEGVQQTRGWFGGSSVEGGSVAAANKETSLGSRG